MDEEKEKMKTGKKLVIALIMILLILTAGAYGYGVHYFTDHFLPGSQVNGFNCSYKTADETEKLLAKEVQAYVLTVETRNNGKESITAKEASLVSLPLRQETTEKRALPQKKPAWSTSRMAEPKS